MGSEWFVLAWDSETQTADIYSYATAGLMISLKIGSNKAKVFAGISGIMDERTMFDAQIARRKEIGPMKTKNAAFVLLAICAVLSLSYCADNKDNAQKSDGGADISPEVGEPADQIGDGLPDVSFDGYKFRVLTREGGGSGCGRHLPEIAVEEEIGEILHDSVYRRNQKVSERFDIEIIPVPVDEYGSGGEGALTNKLKRDVLAGDDTFDVAVGHMTLMSGLATDGVLYNWYDMPNIDFDKPWWVKDATESLAVKGKSFFALGDFTYTYYDYVYNFFFNKRLARDYGLEDPYQLVMEGKWTIDKLHSMTKDIYRDLNGNDTKDFGDLYGYGATSYSMINSYYWAFGGKIAVLDKDGGIQLMINNAKTADIIQKLHEISFDSPGSFVSSNKTPSGDVAWPGVPITMFVNDQAVFAQSRLLDCFVDLRNFAGDYGILPQPMYDEAQEKYMTMADGHTPIMGIPKSASDPTRTGTILEALCAESYRVTIPAYYEIALKVKYSQDEVSSAMIDKIRDGIVYDFGFMYDGFVGLGFIVSELLSDEKTDFASKYESLERRALKYYENVIKAYDEY